MIDHLRQSLKNLISASWRWLRERLPRRRRAEAAPGAWLDGSYSTWEGRLLYAPWVSPKRAYRLYIPAGYRADARLPLLVMLHGCRQDPETFATGTRINALADEHGFLVLYPRQDTRFNPYRCWNWFDPLTQHGRGEAALVAGAAKAVSDAYAVDRRRVYVAGLSAGGALTAILAVRYPNRFAAAAVHAGLPFAAAKTPAGALRAMRNGVSRPAPAPPPHRRLLRGRARATPVAIFHGAEDETVNPRNAEQLADQLLDLQRALHDQPLRADSERVDGDTGRYGYTRYDYRLGDRLVLSRYRIDGLGHAWSGGDASQPYNDPRGPDASRLSWAFLSRHSLP